MKTKRRQQIAIVIFSLIFIFLTWNFEEKSAEERYFSNKMTSEWESLEERMRLMEKMEIESRRVEWTVKQVVSEVADLQEHLHTYANLQNRIKSTVMPDEIKKEKLLIGERIQFQGQDDLGSYQYTLLSYQKDQSYFIELCYQIHYANEENLVDKKYMEKIIRETSAFFDVKSTIFSCIEGASSDKLVEALCEKTYQILNDLNVREITGINEGAFASYTAYTNQWKNAFSSAEKRINLQLAFRMGKQETKWFFGTPVILGEYK